MSLPKNFKTFDYDTINDVILHISYSADYDELFREKIEGRNEHLEQQLTSSDVTMYRLFSMRQEFSQSFHRLMHNPAVTTTIPIELSEQHFPLFLQGRRLAISRADLILQYEKPMFLDSSGALPANAAGSLQVTLSANGSATDNLDFSTSGNADLLQASISPTIFQDFNPSSDPMTVNFVIDNPGDFAPDSPAASDLSAIDDHKLKDVSLYIEYRLV